MSGPTKRTRADIRSTLGKLIWEADVRSDRIGSKISLPPTTHVEYRPDNTGPTNIWDLALIVQKSNEMTWQFWTRFLFIMNKILDCRDQEAVSAFRFNVYDEGIRREILWQCFRTFTKLSNLVAKYCVMEDAWLANQWHQNPSLALPEAGEESRRPHHNR